MLERNEKFYYRCRQCDKKLYDEMMATYAPYTSTEAMKQVNYTWHTQGNGSMNTSVFTLAPKHKTFSMKNILLTRASITAGLQIAGHEKFWENVATSLEFTRDTNFLSTLQSRDMKKKRARIVQRSKGGKIRLSQTKYKKQSSAHNTRIDGYKEGMFYEYGVAVTLAKKTLKTVQQNPAGTPVDQLQYSYYHPLYCITLGHKDCRNKQCGMNVKSEVERKAALKFILAESVNLEVIRNATMYVFFRQYTDLYVHYFCIIY